MERFKGHVLSFRKFTDSFHCLDFFSGLLPLHLFGILPGDESELGSEQDGSVKTRSLPTFYSFAS